MKKIIKFILRFCLLIVVLGGISLAVKSLPFILYKAQNVFEKQQYNDEGYPVGDYKGKNEFGLPIEEYGSSEDLVGANGNDYDKKTLDIKTSTATEEELEKALAKAREDIQNENITNTYTSLFENTNYTRSNFKYELNADMISVKSWVDFQDNFYKEFEKAIARGENFLMYSTPTYLNVRYTSYSNAPCIYGYVKGLGYIIGSVTSDNQLVISIENKYFSKITNTTEYKNNKEEFTWNINTWYSNEDAIKVPVSGTYGYKAIYTDYFENMIRMTSEGFFKNDRADDIKSLMFDKYCFLEGNFMDIIDENTAYHLFGLGFYGGYEGYDISKDNEFLLKTSDDRPSVRLLTDFNNFFMSGNYTNYSYGENYALFGDLADIYLERILSKMFSVNIKPCNNFDADCNYIISDDAPDEYYKFSELLWLLTYNNQYYIYPMTNDEREDYSNAKYVSSDGFHHYTCDAEWYESLTEENRPYITTYVVIENKLTVRNWKKEWVYYDSLDNHTPILNQELETNYDDYINEVVSVDYNLIAKDEAGWRLYFSQNPDKLTSWAKEDNISEEEEIAKLVNEEYGPYFYQEKESGTMYAQSYMFVKEYLAKRFGSHTSILDETNVFNARFN